MVENPFSVAYVDAVVDLWSKFKDWCRLKSTFCLWPLTVVRTAVSKFTRLLDRPSHWHQQCVYCSVDLCMMNE